jgi:hypothetical protein
MAAYMQAQQLVLMAAYMQAQQLVLMAAYMQASSNTGNKQALGGMEVT